MKIVGLDLSLTSSGVAAATPCEDGPLTISTLQTIRPGPKLAGHARMEYVMDQVAAFISFADLVLLEAPVIYTNHKSGAIDNIGLNWLVRHDVLHWNEIPYVLVLPQHLKMYATGFGSGKNAGKGKVLLEADRRYGHLARVSGDDEADALILAAIGCDRAGMPLADVPVTHRRALGGITWPDLKIFASPAS